MSSSAECVPNTHFHDSQPALHFTRVGGRDSSKSFELFSGVRIKLKVLRTSPLAMSPFIVYACICYTVGRSAVEKESVSCLESSPPPSQSVVGT